MDNVKIIIGILLGTLSASNGGAINGAYAQETASTMHQQVGAGTTNNEAYQKLLREADELMKNGRPSDAYSLLELLEFEHAGDERFDYLIGIAALDSGKADKATLAFERVLAVNPASVAARLDMARAYYHLGDLSRAKTEFTAVLKLDPDGAERANVEKYLDEIAAGEAGKRTRLSGYVSAVAGQDSNVNNSTSQSQVFVDTIAATVTLDPTNVKTSDSYYGLAAGGEINHTLDSLWGLYAGADLRQRNNSTQNNFDSATVDARLGIKFEARSNRFRIGISGEQYSLGNVHNSDAAGISAEWNHVFSPSNQLCAFGQYAQYRFANVTMQVNDYNQQAIGGSWLHVMADGKSMIFGSLYSGAEKDVSMIIAATLPNGGRADGEKRFNGLRIGGQTAWSDQMTLFANAGQQTGDYSKINYYFQRQRSDRMYDLVVGANWGWSKLWTLRPQLSYAANNSNIEIYSYDRTDFSLTIRRDFR